MYQREKRVAVDTLLPTVVSQRRSSAVATSQAGAIALTICFWNRRGTEENCAIDRLAQQRALQFARELTKAGLGGGRVGLRGPGERDQPTVVLDGPQRPRPRVVGRLVVDQQALVRRGAGWTLVEPGRIAEEGIDHRLFGGRVAQLL